MLRNLLFIVFLLTAHLSQGQDILKGKVIDENTQALPFASVLLQGTSKGTITDEAGNFSIEAKPGDILTISFIGYVSKSIEIIDQSPLTIRLDLEESNLEEVIVMGYGTTKKKDLTGSVTVMDTEDLKKFPVSNIGMAMQGRLSGVQIVNSSQPGTNPQILVRGFGTIFGDPNPLVVIDGLQTGVGTLSNIDPSSIETLQVLKDASAAAIYGSRAANGVIIITTKKGREDSFQVNYNSEFGIQTVANRFDLMNTAEYAEYTSLLYRNSSTGLVPRNPPAWTSNPDVLAINTDWQDVIFQNALMQNHNINFSGGGKNNTYFFGLGYLNQEGVIADSGFERYNIQINTQFKKSRFTFGETLNIFARFKPETDLANTPANLYGAAPQMSQFDSNNPNGLGAPFPEITGGNNIANPLAYQFRSVQTNAFGLLGNLYGEVDLGKGFSFRSDLNANFTNTNFERYREPVFQSQAAISRTDYEILLRNSSSFGLNTESLIRYNQNFDKHTVSAIAGYTVLVNINRSVTVSANNVEPGTKVPQTGLNPQASAGYFEDRLVSQLARVNYSYDSKYLLTASIRRDGSSNFGQNNRHGVFPSFSLGWQMKEEDFMKNIQWVDNLKVRGGYGELGRTLGSFLATLNSDIRYPWETGIIDGVGPLTIPNENLKWETVKQANIGIDAAFFNNKLVATLDLYNRRSDDMIIRSPIPQYTGIVQQPWINFGSMVNKGVEVELAYNKVVSKDFDYRVKFNITFNRNELLSLNSAQDTLLEAGTLTTIGQPVAVHYGWVTDGINPQNGAMRFQDLNGDGIVDGRDRMVLGSPHPDAFFGITYDAVYRNFDISLFFQGVMGNQIMNESFQLLGSTHRDRNRLSSVLEDAYRSDSNPDGSLPIISLRDDNNNDRISERFIENGDYIRLRNIQVGYTLPPGLLGKNFSKVRGYVSVVNAFVITGYSGLDPDLNNNGSVFLLGRDSFRYPPVRSFNAGVQVSF